LSFRDEIEVGGRFYAANKGVYCCFEKTSAKVVKIGRFDRDVGGGNGRRIGVGVSGVAAKNLAELEKSFWSFEPDGALALFAGESVKVAAWVDEGRGFKV
jgi:hypothetical protein